MQNSFSMGELLAVAEPGVTDQLPSVWSLTTQIASVP